jgi:hypothetical protein
MYALRINLEESARKMAFLVSVKTTVNQETSTPIQHAIKKREVYQGDEERRKKKCV